MSRVINRRVGNGLKIAVSGLALAISSMAQAQPTVAEPEQVQDEQSDTEIIVTASRRQETLQNAPVSMSVADPDALALRGLTTLEDVVNYTPGVYFQEGGSPGRQTITMRGVSQTLTTPTVGMYLDDIPLGGTGHWGEANFTMFDLVQNNIDQIEIIKGPQGTLYGTSAMGGVIRYITKDPTADLSGGFSVDLSTTKEGSLNHLTKAWANVPLVQDKIGISLSGFSRHEGGFIDRSPASTAGVGENVDEAEVIGGMVKIFANITDDFTGSLIYARTDTSYKGLSTIDLAGPPFAPIAGPFLSLQGAQDSSTSLEVFGGTFTYDFGWASLLSSTAYQRVRTDALSDQTIIFGPLIEQLAGTAPGSVMSVSDLGYVETKRFTQEVRLTSANNRKFEWILGAFYSDEESVKGEIVEGQPVDFTLLDYKIPGQTEEFAIFGNATYYVTPRFDLTVGARLAWVKTGVALTDEPEIFFADDIPLTTSKGTVDTYLFAARYRPTDDLSLYARVASGYRPSGASLPLLDAGGNPIVDPIIETDTLWSYEVGAKGTLFDRLLTFDLSAWYLNWKNLQAVIFVQGLSTGGNANSDVTAYGFEASTTLKPIRGWSINANLAYTNSQLDDDETAAFGAVAGEKLPLVPRWTWSIDTEYRFPISNQWESFVGGGVRFVGDRNTGFVGGIGENGALITPLIANIPLESYHVVDLRAGINMDPITLSFYVTNLFNEYGYTNGNARPVVQGIVANAAVLRPRTIGAVLSVNF